MDNLPLIALDRIAQSLSIRDIASCCSMSTSWREAFNHDYIWQPRCDQELAAYLSDLECRVEPKFASPDNDDSSLSPICNWRLCYMREVHLWNNWRQGRFSKEFFGILCTRSLSPFIFFLNNNQVLLKLFNEKDIMLWDLKGSPVHLNNPITLTLGEEINFCELIGDKIMFLQCNTIQINYIDSCSAEWRIQGVYNISSNYSNTSLSFVTANILVVVCFDGLIELFDTKTCETLKVSQMPEPLSDDVYIKDVVQGEKHSKYFAVLLNKYIETTWHYQDPEQTHVETLTVYIYSIEKLDFHSFKTSIPLSNEEKPYVKVLIHEEFLAIFNHGTIKMYNYLTSNLIIDCINKFSFYELKHKFPVFSMFYFKENKINKTLFLNLKSKNLVKLPCKIFGYKSVDIHRLVHYVRKNSTFPEQVNSVCLLSQYSSTLLNSMNTKLIDEKGPDITTFW